jgi:hypothetical protein
MYASALHFVSNRLRAPAAAVLCIAVMQLLVLVVGSCHQETLPMGAVRVAVNR